ncbi:MAG: type II toxin-antitoxin system VapC family toxin [Arcicella sp.]|nr:type II toxin-antitoxin system VapC family toxin [Arcicella sp.]
MGKKYLIDTNIIIDFLENRLPLNAKLFVAEVIDDEPNISIINKIELLGFSVVTPEIIEFTDSTNIINLTEDVANKTIDLRKKRKIKLPDAIIAATVLVYDMTLVSRNSKDFDEIDGLEFINPHEM